ncbi:helix-turn-helix domain-containing protein [Nonomuraea bangladeshensis]|uniref:helix-turn-helix domain-containing protein n=1 Tax=Nonomuraea bangladeshensis TaxID=404385 RepID=UPI0031D23EFE
MTQSTPDDLQAAIVRKYCDERLSIRTIAEAVGKSYGFVHRVLTDADVTLRPRGGARKRNTAAEADSN